MLPKIPEKNKKAGVCYAVTDDGLELPVIDITHPAFAIQLGDQELDGLLHKHLKDVASQERSPAFIRRLVIGFMQRQSFLMRGIADSAGTFMSGMNTYILKLGPDNLSDAYATNIDRKLAGALPVLSMRLRFQDIVRLLADSLAPALGGSAQAVLHLLNIGGGPAIDSLNALIVLQKEHPGLLDSRQTFVHILDQDDIGPNFGRRALASLMSENGPLLNLDIHFDHIKYDWSDTTLLRGLVGTFNGGPVVAAASSEGALFEYGSDAEIIANLKALFEIPSGETGVVGTVTRADKTGRVLNSGSQAAINLRGLEAFRALALRAGWKITKSIDRPLSHDILMEKA
jgi:hypothetical protein